MSIETIKVPELGDVGEVEVIELLVSVGQAVKENDSLLVLESDKAAMEIPAPMAGVIKSIAINLGDQVKTGSTILTLETTSTDAKPEVQDSKTEEKATSKSASSEPAVASKASAVPAAPGNSTPATSKASKETIKVPDLGDDAEVEVIEVHIKPGDKIKKDDSLITLESDKAAMEVPSPKAGEVVKVLLKTGDKVVAGAAILELLINEAPATESGGKETVVAKQGIEKESAGKPPALIDATMANEPATKQPAAPAPTESADPQRSASAGVYAGPAVRKMARELGANLTQVSGTGTKGRILKEDLQQFVKTRLNSGVASSAQSVGAAPDIDFSQFGDVEQRQLSKLHKLTAVSMHRNWSNVPHVAQFNEADVTGLEAFRAEQKASAEKKGLKLTFIPFLLKACARALQEYPQFNVSLHSSGEFLIQKKYFHIGVAVATEAGLVVPVLRDVDQKSIWQLAAELAQLTDKAKQRRLSKEDMQGACFSISSLGAIGGTGFIPIVNAPEVAILGVGKTAIKPVFIDGEFVPRNVLPITLSYDHRAVNGVDGGLFSSYLVTLLEDIRLLLL